jgi:hypothetical protein
VKGEEYRTGVVRLNTNNYVCRLQAPPFASLTPCGPSRPAFHGVVRYHVAGAFRGGHRPGSGTRGATDACSETRVTNLMPIQLLLASAAIFGPLTGWLAARRGRLIVAWFAFGVVLGPIATLLVFVAPPGHCPSCEARTAGWLGHCPECGVELPGLLRVMPAPGVGSRALTATLLVRPPDSAARPAGGAMPETAPAPAPAPTRAYGWGVSPTTPVVPPIHPEIVEDEPRSIDWLAARRAGAAERVGAVRPIGDTRSSETEARSEGGQVATVLGTGVCLTGVAPLLVGGRYVLTREGDEVVFSGPVERSDSHVVRRPLSMIDVVLLNGRLMLTRRDGSGSIVAVFQSLALYPGVDIEAELSPTMPLAAQQ